MAESIEQALKQEASNLEKVLNASPEYLRLKIIREALMQLQNVRTTPKVNGAVNHSEVRYVPMGDLKRVASSIHEAAEYAIQDAGHPLTTRELLAAVGAYGKSPTGKNPATNLSNNLSSQNRFVSLIWRGNKVWWLSGREIPPE